MSTAHPATRTALAFSEFLYRSVEMVFSGGGGFNGDNPTNPFITGQGSDIFPSDESLTGRGKGCS